MRLSEKAQEIYQQLSSGNAKLGDLRILAKEIKTDLTLATELWSTATLLPRLLAILIMDKKQLTPEIIDQLFADMERHDYNERLQLADWFLANQLTKDKKTIALMESWENNHAALKRRLYWYFQGRLRWTGQTPPANTEALLSAIEKNLLKETPEVQWAMNFTAGWIGIFDKPYRDRCVAMGEKLGLYKDEVVHKGCTPNFLPKFIEGEVAKRSL